MSRATYARVLRLRHNNNVILVLLPGLEGTAELFEPFLNTLPREVQSIKVGYPRDVRRTYAQLVDFVASKLPPQEPYILIAESYSGPVALQLAKRQAGNLRGIVLVASFWKRPLGLAGYCLARLPLAYLYRIRPPVWLVRRFLLDEQTPPALVTQFRDALSTVSPEVLASRTREVLAVDCTELAESCPVPVLCLQAARDHLVRRQSRIHGFTAVSIPAPHLLLQYAPQAAADAIEIFAAACGEMPSQTV